MEQLPERHWLTLAEAATYTGVTVQTVRKYIASGHLPGYRLGPKFVRVDLADVERLLREIPTWSNL